MRKNYWVVFEKFEKSLKKFSRKRWSLILAKYFEKKNIPIFFYEYSKRCAETYILGNWNNWEKLCSSFQDMGQKKKGDRPSIHPIHPSIHPSHPSIKIGGGAWYPVAGYWARVLKGWNTVFFLFLTYLSFLSFSLPCLACLSFYLSFLFFLSNKNPFKFYKGVPSLMYWNNPLLILSGVIL